jgi:hypothetical protein
MSYKYTSGSVRRGDLYYEDDRVGSPTYIDFGYDTIALRPSGSAILYAEDDAVGIGTTTPNSTLTVNGSLQFKVGQLSGNATLDDTDHVASVDCNSGNVVVTLPSVSEEMAGRVYIIKRADTGPSGGGNSLIIARNGANIDGAATNLSGIANGTCHTLICVGGAGWIIISKYTGGS